MMGTLTDFSSLNPLSFFVETGTGCGETLILAAEYFLRCDSIEYDEGLYQAAVEKFEPYRNVFLYQGHSPDVLRRILDPLLPVVFWLDAHYTGNGKSMAPGGECPLLDELRVIAGLDWKQRPVILIDDAFMFDDTVPHPQGWERFNRTEWPRIKEVDVVLRDYKRSLTGDIFRYEA